LEKAYYCVPLAEEMQPYFCFSHLGLVIKPKILVFGYSSAPYYFNKIVREVMKFIRRARVKAAAYFDDLLFVLRQGEEKNTIQFVKRLLDTLGWITNEKSIWEMTKRIEYLGVLIDSEHMKLFLSETKKKKIKTVLEEVTREFEEKKTYTMGKLATLLGKLSWARVAMKGVATWTRALEMEKNKGAEEVGWENKETEIEVQDVKRVGEELKFWNTYLDKLSGEGQEIVEPAVPSSIIVQTDASETGWGATIKGERKVELAGSLRKEKKDSSTLREIVAVKEALEKGRHLLKGKRVEVRMDSQALSHIMLKQSSRTSEIHDFMKQIWYRCYEDGIELEIKWIPREENKEADLLSRVFKNATDKEREEIEKIAKAKNIKTTTNTEGEKDAFLIIKPDQNYIAKSIKLITEMKRKVALVVPFWQSALWWPLIGNKSQERLTNGVSVFFLT
jgi:hypothetical protein